MSKSNKQIQHEATARMLLGFAEMLKAPPHGLRHGDAIATSARFMESVIMGKTDSPGGEVGQFIARLVTATSLHDVIAELLDGLEELKDDRRN
mgnify:CR=1 FL=1